MQLKVIKADGSEEDFLHTKVIGAIGHALSGLSQSDVYVAEQLADVVTYYLHKEGCRRISSGEIFSVVKAVLSSTGHEEAALSLEKRHYERKLQRARTEVIGVELKHLNDAEALYRPVLVSNSSRWDKSRIVNDLIEEYAVSRQVARTVASMVEEKIFKMGLTRAPVSLIKQLVLSDTAAVLRAQEHLQIT